jgi:hypothetical protein
MYIKNDRYSHFTPKDIRMQVLKEEIRDTIVANAEQLFAKKGYNSATIDEIAKKSAISKGNVYLYFKTKKELFAAVIPTAITKIIADFILRRIRAVMPPNDNAAAHNKAGEEFIHFLIQNRLKILIMINPNNSSMLGSLRKKVIRAACRAYRVFCSSKNVSPDVMNNSNHTILATMLYDNLITSIGHILGFKLSINDYTYLLQNLFHYHYTGIISISPLSSKERIV